MILNKPKPSVAHSPLFTTDGIFTINLQTEKTEELIDGTMQNASKWTRQINYQRDPNAKKTDARMTEFFV